MKKLLIISLLLQGCIGFSRKQPKLLIETPNQNKLFKLDTVVSGTVIKIDIKIKNIGTAPLIITRLETSSGADVAERDPKPITPNDTAIVFWHFDTAWKVGNVRKTVVVTTNEANPVQVWTFYGHLLPAPEKIQKNKL
jgi:hypothetical protein